MKKYVVWNTCNNDMICFDTHVSAEEYILSIAETEDFVSFNYGINRLNDDDTLEDYIEDLRDWFHQDDRSNECVCLYYGGYNFYIKEIPYLED